MRHNRSQLVELFGPAADHPNGMVVKRGADYAIDPGLTGRPYWPEIIDDPEHLYTDQVTGETETRPAGSGPVQADGICCRRFRCLRRTGRAAPARARSSGEWPSAISFLVCAIVRR